MGSNRCRPRPKDPVQLEYGGNSGDSVVSFELFDEGGKTRMRLTHVGLETFAPETNPDFARGNFLAGWTALTDFLKDFLASA